MATDADALTFRAATRDDLPAVQALATTVWRAHYPGIVTAEQIDYMLERLYALPMLERFTAEQSAGIEVASAGGALVAFAAWYRSDDAAEVKLDRLYVLPDHQRRGIGARLIERVAERARALGAARLVLNVNKRNAQARRAYEKHGFAVRDGVVIDIGNGYVMDDFVMERGL